MKLGELLHFDVPHCRGLLTAPYEMLAAWKQWKVLLVCPILHGRIACK